jgi:triosephosphate isomerase
LSLIKEVSKDMGLEIGAQDISVFEKGAHTGETSRFQIKELADYCLVGHSESRVVGYGNHQERCMHHDRLNSIVCFVGANQLK